MTQSPFTDTDATATITAYIEVGLRVAVCLNSPLHLDLSLKEETHRNQRIAKCENQSGQNPSERK